MRTLTVAALLITALCVKEEPKPEVVSTPVKKPATRRIEMAVTTDGFVPHDVKVKANEPVTLVVTRKTDETCATEILIEGTDINAPLPLDKPVEVAWTPTKAGQVKFGCAMDKMIGGILLVE
ncbi:MAG: cupredoxin domain-containing protein [Archangium sp.]|nr:cupredoxin domain-containing protein [Archangium sp.]